MGPGGVGKSALVLRFMNGEFLDMCVSARPR
jgi:GTPase SAR1 family protein